MEWQPGPWRGPQRRNPPLVDGSGRLRGRTDLRLVQLMRAAEECTDRAEASRLIQEAYALGEASARGLS